MGMTNRLFGTDYSSTCVYCAGSTAGVLSKVTAKTLECGHKMHFVCFQKWSAFWYQQPNTRLSPIGPKDLCSICVVKVFQKGTSNHITEEAKDKVSSIAGVIAGIFSFVVTTCALNLVLSERSFSFFAISVVCIPVHLFAGLVAKGWAIIQIERSR